MTAYENITPLLLYTGQCQTKKQLVHSSFLKNTKLDQKEANAVKSANGSSSLCAID